jgi:glycosyltransferase involved in cell wall biosynthesis
VRPEKHSLTRERDGEETRPALLFVNQHYYPDVASTGQHLTDLCEHLQSEAYAVRVICGRGKYLAGRMQAPLHEVHNSVRITRIRTTSFGRGTHLGRLIDYATFYVQVLWTLLARTTRFDGVVFLTTPPLLSVIGWIAKRLRGQRYGIWSMDLHPDAEIALGMLREGSASARFLSWAMALGYRNADFVVDLGHYMKQRLIAKGVRRDRLHTVHVWSRSEEIEPMPRAANPVREELGLGGRFVVMYSGNAGIVHEFDVILEAMRRLDDDPRFYFLFVGDGPQRTRIEAYAREQGLKNFSYRGYFPREQLRYSLSAADAHLISLREPFAGIAVPGKLYGIMASARPAIFVGPARCESADSIRQAQCGAVIDPATRDGAGALVDTLVRWAENAPEVRRLGERAREAFLQMYEREPNCAEWERVISETWGAAGQRGGSNPEGGRDVGGLEDRRPSREPLPLATVPDGPLADAATPPIR